MNMRFVFDRHDILSIKVMGSIMGESEIRTLEESIGTLCTYNPRQVFFDVRECSVFDTRIVSPLIKMYTELKKISCSFCIVVNTDEQEQFFSAIELDKIIRVKKMKSKTCLYTALAA
jgi:anti-anti-sigma regulatory factor